MYERQIRKSIFLNKSKFGIKEDIKTVRISKAGAGENNMNMLAVVNRKHKLLFRIALQPYSEKNMDREFEILKFIPKGFGSEPIYLDSTKKIIPKKYSVLRYIEGKHVKRWTDTHLKMHARKLAQLHKKKYPSYGYLHKKQAKLDLYNELLREIRDYRKRCPELFEDQDIKELLPKLKRYIKDNNHLFTSLTRFSLTHSDLCLVNILFTKEGIRYIDWEWSGFKDNAMDVAMLYDPDMAQPPWKIRLTGKREKLYLDTYLKYIKDKTLKERVQAWIICLKCTDLLFLKWKFLKYDKEPIKDLPKKHYVKMAEEVVKSIRKRFP